MCKGLYDCICVSSLPWDHGRCGQRGAEPGRPAAMQHSRCWLTALPSAASQAARDVSSPCRIRSTGASGWLPASGAAVLTTGGRARCQGIGQGQTHSCTTPTSKEETRHHSERRLGLEALGCWVVLLSNSTDDVPLPLLASMTLGASPPPRCLTVPLTQTTASHTSSHQNPAAKSIHAQQGHRAPGMPRGCPGGPAALGSVRPRHCASEE